MVNKEFFQALDLLERDKKISKELLIDSLESASLPHTRRSTAKAVRLRSGSTKRSSPSKSTPTGWSWKRWKIRTSRYLSKKRAR